MKRHSNVYPFWLSIPALLLYTLFTVVPVTMSVILSFTNWNVKRWYSPVFSGLANYKEVLSDGVFATSLKNTFILAFGTTAIKIVFGILLALVLCKKFRGNGILRTIYYLPCVLSPIVIGILFQSILSNQGLLNNLLGDLNLSFLKQQWLGYYGTSMLWLVITEGWMWIGFNMFIFISGLQAIPSDYYEAASIDGASKTTQFFKITLPLLVPAITVNTTLNIAGGLKIFDIVYVLTNGGPGTDTQVLSTYVFRSFGLGYLGESAAASVVLTIIVLVITFIMNKYLTGKEVHM